MVRQICWKSNPIIRRFPKCEQVFPLLHDSSRALFRLLCCISQNTLGVLRATRAARISSMSNFVLIASTPAVDVRDV